MMGGLLLAQTPQTAQDLALLYAPLALDERAVTGSAEGLRQCATSYDLLRRTATGITTMQHLADGRPLRADQFPRFLRPTHNGDFGLSNFLVIGDHETVTFERVDADAEDFHTDETWTRASTQEVDGQIVSVFNPTWGIDVLHATLRRYSWGVDHPFIFWGRFVVPAAAPVVTPGGVRDHVGEAEGVNVYLAVVPPNILESEITQINDDVQFTSHAVNVWDSDFGDSRVQGGETEFNEPEITRKFYEHFNDEYDVIAIMSQATQVGDFFGFHGNVRNEISGIGLDLFDSSAIYGSAGRLHGIEGYPPGGWAVPSTVWHEQGHQYGDYSGTWAQVGPAAPTVRSVIERKGHAPDAHSPLAFPHEFYYSSTTEAQREIVQVEGGFEVARTMPLIVYNPLTLYRMGLIPPEELPTYQVFLEQGQFNEETSVAPEVGTAVTGETVEVTVNDMMAADGPRSGPVETNLRRALVYVSRAGLVPPEEMHIVNYFAKRLGESSGVTSYDRYPSFSEATGGRSTMATDISPKPDEVTTVAGALPSAAKIEPGPDVSCAKIGTQAIIGFTLDDELGGCVTGGTTITVSGTLDLTDRDDYDQVCMRIRRYGDPSEDQIFECPVLSGNRFSVNVTFPADKPGGYDFSLFAFWPDSGGQFSRTIYTGGIEVLPTE